MEEEIKQLQEDILAKKSNLSSNNKDAETVANALCRYKVATNSDSSIILPQWLAENAADPALEVNIPAFSSQNANVPRSSCAN
jgi:hypothetical protein